LDTFEAGTLRKHFSHIGKNEAFASILVFDREIIEINAINFKEN